MFEQSTETAWSDLPEPLTARIVRLALHAGARALPLWLRLGLVCRHAHSHLRNRPAHADQ